MSTSFYAMTIIVDSTMKSREFGDANALMTAQPAVMQPAPGLKTFAGDGGVITKVFGSSKGNYFASAVARLCALAVVEGLEIFSGAQQTPCQWKISLDGEEAASEFACGYWLEGSALSTTLKALNKLLTWSRDNARQLGGEDFLGYYLEETDGILKAIKRGERVNGPRMLDVDWDGEGTGPGYLFAYLGTLRHLLGNAIAAGHAVLHVVETDGSDAPPQPAAAVPYSVKYDAKYWLNEGDMQYEDADISEGREATSALKNAIKSYSTALEMDPELAEAHYGWGRALSALAGNCGGKKAREFWSAAVAKYEQALAMESSLTSNVYDVLVNTGTALDELARLGTDEEAKTHWRAALAVFEAALKLPPPTVWPDMELYQVHINCGEALRELAQRSAPDEATPLREAAKVSYEAGLKFMPDEPHLLYLAGGVLLALTHCTEPSERERLLYEAELKFKGAEKEEQGSASYSLACLSALRGDAAGAVKWLKFAASCGTLPSRKYIKGDQDFSLIRSDPVFAAWLAG